MTTPTAPLCLTLDDVRANIDRLDREIVGLLAERSGYVLQAARFKANAAEVAAPSRVEQVIAKVRTLAAARGLAPDVAEATYRAMITAFIALEHRAFDARHA